MSEFHQDSDRIDLGIAIAHDLNPGERLTCEQIAAYCDCSVETIDRIEKKALPKIRKGLKRQGIEAEFADSL